MAWTVDWDRKASKDLEKLDAAAQQRIIRYLERQVATEQDPRRLGKALISGRVDLWRYRVGNYRVICSIEDERVIVLVLTVGHRSRIYKWHGL